MGEKEHEYIFQIAKDCDGVYCYIKQGEIIRCKDCAYYGWDCVDAPYGMTKMTCWCDLHYDAVNENLVVNPDDYCKWAKRRSDEAKRSD